MKFNELNKIKEVLLKNQSQSLLYSAVLKPSLRQKQSMVCIDSMRAGHVLWNGQSNNDIKKLAQLKLIELKLHFRPAAKFAFDEHRTA